MLTKSAQIGQFVAAADSARKHWKVAGATTRYMDTEVPSAENADGIWRANCKARKVANSGWSVVCIDAG